ncbi:hypothetical protein ALC60_06810 [Trachymyrmex zeteki]|uniref:Uncharacterized protein n=1 Tax=Mycetomoellerius zeteki TaxID=64791 RepID=A0A151X1X2_9HYME|nr:hypothetical protein ALC60_06810 [Trachymyrmex zeteki]
MKKNDVERGDGGVRSTLSYLASATPPIDRPTVLGPDARSQLAEYRERDLIPFKGEARRRTKLAPSRYARWKKIDAERGCAGARQRGEKEGGLKEAHCLPSEADNSVMNVSNARPRSGL